MSIKSFNLIDMRESSTLYVDMINQLQCYAYTRFINTPMQFTISPNITRNINFQSFKYENLITEYRNHTKVAYEVWCAKYLDIIIEDLHRNYPNYKITEIVFLISKPCNMRILDMICKLLNNKYVCKYLYKGDIIINDLHKARNIQDTTYLFRTAHNTEILTIDTNNNINHNKLDIGFVDLLSQIELNDEYSDFNQIDIYNMIGKDIDDIINIINIDEIMRYYKRLNKYINNTNIVFIDDKLNDNTLNTTYGNKFKRSISNESLIQTAYKYVNYIQYIPFTNTNDVKLSKNIIDMYIINTLNNLPTQLNDLNIYYNEHFGTNITITDIINEGSRDINDPNTTSFNKYCTRYITNNKLINLIK